MKKTQKKRNPALGPQLLPKAVSTRKRVASVPLAPTEPGSKERDKAIETVMLGIAAHDDAQAKRERARASAKALEPAPRRGVTETVTTQIQKATSAGKGSAKKQTAAKPDPQPVSTDLAIHVNKTGRICFGKVAAQRIGELKHMLIAVDGKALRLEATAKSGDGTVEIRRAGENRPYVSATKLLKELGFDGTKPLDAIATPLGATGFMLKVG